MGAGGELVGAVAGAVGGVEHELFGGGGVVERLEVGVAWGDGVVVIGGVLENRRKPAIADQKRFKVYGCCVGDGACVGGYGFVLGDDVRREDGAVMSAIRLGGKVKSI